MPSPHSTKAPNEHLIFVKNVPGYFATDEIRSIFAKYNPASFKNVYPNSNVTTIVIGFRTKEEAARAQAATDQTRLGHVVLKVETYNQKQSVRYLRDQGQANRPRGAVQEDESQDYDEEPVQEDIPVFSLPIGPHAAKDNTAAPMGTTWADIAGNRRAPADEAPAIPEVQSPATTESTPISTPRMPETVLQKHLVSGLEDKDSLLLPPSLRLLSYTAPDPLSVRPPHRRSPSTESSFTAEVEHELRKLSNMGGWSMAAAQWADDQGQTRFLVDPLDTTMRIRLMHYKNCAFCQKRDRS
ncbi:hypothetical protein ACET3X_001590 [Alternaria dauci]|uniref:RRM domain-containing protein n=1 Tax=Alternaria dauci TaxID=48095 RepID=A0ABR3UXT1_9PLEO